MAASLAAVAATVEACIFRDCGVALPARFGRGNIVVVNQGRGENVYREIRNFFSRRLLTHPGQPCFHAHAQ